MATSAAAIYQSVYGYIINSGEMDSDGLGKLLKNWKPEPVNKCNNVGMLALVNLCANLRADMASSDNKRERKGHLEKAALSIIKNAPRDDLKDAIMRDGLQCVCDGYRVVRIKEPINLPELTVPNTMEFSRLFQRNLGEYQNLELPSLSEVKSYIRTKKAENRALCGKNASKCAVNWDFGEGLPLVDAAYLADMLTAFPDAKAEYKNKVSAIFFFSELGDGLLLPVRR